MCKHENKEFVAETIDPEDIYWCKDCGAIISGEDITLPNNLINKPVETTNEQPNLKYAYILQNSSKILIGDGAKTKEQKEEIINYLENFLNKKIIDFCWIN